jgi:hypothetical protein
LREIGVDRSDTPTVLGPWVTYDEKHEQFVHDYADQANALSQRQYRKPFVVPTVA